MTRIKVKCKGIRPLLMDRMPEDVLDSLITRVRKPIRTDLSFEEIAAGKLYRNGNGETGIPADNIFSCLVQAGTLIKYDGKRNISTREESLLPAFLDIEEEFIPLNHGAQWVVDKKLGRNPTDGTAVGIIRPRFDDWEIEFTLVIDEKLISEDKIKQLVEYAGKFKGLGAFRRKGRFGRFTIIEWKRLDGKKKK